VNDGGSDPQLEEGEHKRAAAIKRPDWTITSPALLALKEDLLRRGMTPEDADEFLRTI
jgi:hypothetical protein